MTTDTKADLQTYLDSLELTYTATFIPTPQPKVEHPQLHWLITLSRGPVSAQFPYSQGIGHVIGYKTFPKTLWGEEQTKCFRMTCETGKLYKVGDTIGRFPVGQQPAPKLADVLYCLVLDADVRQYADYEEWALNLGYDPDSRKGEAIYRACQKQTTDFLRVLGGGKVGRNALDILEKLEELYQDY